MLLPPHFPHSYTCTPSHLTPSHHLPPSHHLHTLTLHPHTPLSPHTTLTPSHSKDYGIWERGDKINHGETELNATSIGMAKVRGGEVNIFVFHRQSHSPKWRMMKYSTCAVHIEDCEGDGGCLVVVAQWQNTGCTSPGVLCLIPGNCRPFQCPPFTSQA